MERLKHRIKELREKMGWTQEELARQMYVCLSTIQRWEIKGAKPNRLACRQLRKLFRKAGVDEPKNTERE